MFRTFIIMGVLLSSLAHADPNEGSYITAPPGTIIGNPQAWPGNPVPHAQAFANVGHLASLNSASMTSTADQLMKMMVWGLTRYRVTNAYAVCGTAESGAIGGVYTAASKGGTAVVPATATWLADNPIATPTPQTAGQFYFSLSTAGTGGPCDIYVDGIGLQ